MLNALNALSDSDSLLVRPPYKNKYLCMAILGSITLHLVILKINIFNVIFGVVDLSIK